MFLHVLFTVVLCTALYGNFVLYLALYKFCLPINYNNDNSNSIHPDANCRFLPVFLFDIFFIYVTSWLIFYLNNNSACVYLLTVCVRVFYLNTSTWTSTDVPCDSDSIICLTTSPAKILHRARTHSQALEWVRRPNVVTLTKKNYSKL